MGDRSLQQDEKADERHYTTSKPLQKPTTSHRRAISFYRQGSVGGPTARIGPPVE
jgi:hypothetical protein